MGRLVFWFFLILTLEAHPAGEYSTIGGRAAGMGFTSVSIADPWSVFNNPAGLSSLYKFSAGIYFENRFLMKELSLKAVYLDIPVKAGTFGLSCQEFGFNLYNEMKVGLAYGKKLGKSFSAGVQLDYLRIHLAEDLGTKNLFTFEIGIQYHINRNLSFGVHCYNPISVKLLSYADERIPTVINMGFAWKFSEGFVTTIEVEKDIQLKPVYKAGLEYHFVKPLFVRIGLLTNPTMFTFGFGVDFGQVRLDRKSTRLN